MRKRFDPAVAMFRATNGQLLTNKDQMLSRWKEYFEQNFNESFEEELHANQKPTRENDGIIDWPSRDDIEAINYLKKRWTMSGECIQ
jgi:hypothetical protein